MINRNIKSRTCKRNRIRRTRKTWKRIRKNSTEKEKHKEKLKIERKFNELANHVSIKLI